MSAIGSAPYFIDADLIEGSQTTAFGAAIFASMIALLTNERIAAGKPGLGFLNPLIYQNPAAFKDIPTGEPHTWYFQEERNNISNASIRKQPWM